MLGGEIDYSLTSLSVSDEPTEAEPKQSERAGIERERNKDSEMNKLISYFLYDKFAFQIATACTMSVM